MNAQMSRGAMRQCSLGTRSSFGGRSVSISSPGLSRSQMGSRQQVVVQAVSLNNLISLVYTMAAQPTACLWKTAEIVHAAKEDVEGGRPPSRSCDALVQREDHVLGADIFCLGDPCIERVSSLSLISLANGDTAGDAHRFISRRIDNCTAIRPGARGSRPDLLLH